MSGSVRKRGKTWTAYWFVAGPDGRRRQRSKGGFRTQREARAYLTAVLSAIQEGTYTEPKKLTLTDFCRNEWLPALGDLRPSTVASYTDIVERQIVPHLGGNQLGAITPAMVRDWLAELSVKGGSPNGRRAGEGLSPRSVQYAATILGRVYKDAIGLGYVARNPVTGVRRPTPRPPEMRVWTAQEAGAFLRHVADDRLYAAWLLFLTRGPRRGEVCGLRWADVDLDAGRLSIAHTRVSVGYRAQSSTPKTDKGRRTIPLDRDLSAALRAHRARQLEERMALGVRTESDLVFTNVDGMPLHPETLSSRFETLTRSARLRRIRLHDTRHTAATLALTAGIPAKVVAEWLGHSSITITLDTYSHLMPSMSEHAGAVLTSLVLGDRATASGQSLR